jgi:hypothetical protein
MSYASLVSGVSTTLLSTSTLTMPWWQSKAFSSKSLRASYKGESKRHSIATLVQTSHSVVALFASATLVPSSASFVGASDTRAAIDEQTLASPDSESKCTLRRSNAVRKSHPIPTAASAVQLERTQTTTSAITSECDSGSSHHCPMSEDRSSCCSSRAILDHSDDPFSSPFLDDFVRGLEQEHTEMMHSRGGFAGFTPDEVTKWLAEDHKRRH